MLQASTWCGVTLHVGSATDWDAARRVASRAALQPSVEADARDVYHSILPLPFLSPVPHEGDASSVKLQKENEATYRQLLVQAVLAILLPTEDLENPCLTALVEQILAELIIGNVIAGKASQPWLLYEAICIAAKSLDEQKARAKTRIMSGKDQPSPSLSGLGQDAEKSPKWTAQGVFVLAIHLGILLFNAVRFMVVTLADSISLPPRTALHLDEEAADDVENDKQPSPPTDTNLTPAKVPVLAFKLWTCFGNLIELEDRKPWLGGFISLLQTAAVNGPWRIAGLDGPLDR